MNVSEIQKEWALLAKLLPNGWREAARTEGAIKRARDIKDAETLLRLILLHAGAGLSLRQATARAKVAGLASISDVALLKRLRSSEPWLRWITTRLLSDSVYAPSFFNIDKERRLRVVDATTIQEPGATGTSWRVHYSIRLPTLVCDFFELTDVNGGETYKRLPIEQGDIILGDRGYCHREGVAHVLNSGGDVVVRLNSNNFPLLDRHDRPFDLLGRLRTLRGWKPKEWAVRFEASQDIYEARLCAIRKSPLAAERARKKAIREAKKKKRKILPATLEMTKYVFVLATFPYKVFDTNAILELYRVRWQVEMSFKRMKSLMQVGHVPKYDVSSARAWIQAKILTVLLIEHLQEKASFFSPWGFQIERT